MKTRMVFFYAISALVLLRGAFSNYGLDYISKLLSEALIFLWLLYELPKPKYKTSKGIFLFGLLYCLWIGFVSLYHGDSLFEYYIYSRYFILSFILFYIAHNILNIIQYTDLFLKAIDFIVLFQIIASVSLFFLVGRLERNVGTMSSTGGSLATVWPLTFAPYYFLRFIIKGTRKDILLFTGLIFIGFASGKRAVYFLIPLSIIVIVYVFLGSKMFIQRRKVKMRVVYSTIFLFVVLLLGISRTESLAQGNGFSLEALSSAVNYVGEYSTNESLINGESIGRASSTMNTFKSLSEDDNAIFGNGLSILKGEINFSRYNIGYGVTGLIRELISAGWIAGGIYVLFYFQLLIKMRKGKYYLLGKKFDNNLFWIWLLGISGLISILITIIGYSRVFSQSLNPIIFVLIAVGISLRVINKFRHKYKPSITEKKP